jgi:hypothetical protein
LKYARQQVDVHVTVELVDPYSHVQGFFHLSAELALDVDQPDPPQQPLR